MSPPLARFEIASRAELLPNYGRLQGDIPKNREIRRKSPALAGVDILQKAKSNEIGEHARTTI